MFLYIIIIIISLLYFINYVSNALSVLLYAYDGDYRSMLMSHWMMIICCTIIEFPLLLFLLYYMLYIIIIIISLCFHFSFFCFWWTHSVPLYFVLTVDPWFILGIRVLLTVQHMKNNQIILLISSDSSIILHSFHQRQRNEERQLHVLYI